MTILEWSTDYFLQVFLKAFSVNFTFDLGVSSSFRSNLLGNQLLEMNYVLKLLRLETIQFCGF